MLPALEMGTSWRLGCRPPVDPVRVASSALAGPQSPRPSSRRAPLSIRCTAVTPRINSTPSTPDVVAHNQEPSVSNQPGQGLSIVSFLASRRLLVTGSTGFLAKVLVEKILWEQPKVGRLYLLIQPRGDQSPEQRLAEMIQSSPLFERLRRRHGDAYQSFMLSKLAAVQGNLTQPGMGLAAEDSKLLQLEVEVIVNSAASTSFDERFDSAVRLNTMGAKECALFAAGCQRLEVLVHVSTAFVNGLRRGYTSERPFEFGGTVAAELRGTGAPLDVEAEIARALSAPAAAEARLRAAGFSGSELDQAVEQEMVSMGMSRAQELGWQDTYVYTKAMGEMLLRRAAEAAGVPCCVVRPSIVESTWQEPMPGWIEGLRMADPIIIAYGKNQMVGFAGDRGGVLDVVPCDIVINACLAAMVQHARSGGAQPFRVYHVATSTANPLGIQRFVDIVSSHFGRTPMSDRRGDLIRVDPMIIYSGYGAMMVDTWRRYALRWQLAELKERLMPWNKEAKLSPEDRKTKLIQQKTYEQLQYLARIYTPYTFYEARFGSEHTQGLHRALIPAERDRFSVDLAAFSWEDYLGKVHIPGLRRFVLKGRA